MAGHSVRSRRHSDAATRTRGRRPAGTPRAKLATPRATRETADGPLPQPTRSWHAARRVVKGRGAAMAAGYATSRRDAAGHQVTRGLERMHSSSDCRLSTCAAATGAVVSGGAAGRVAGPARHGRACLGVRARREGSRGPPDCPGGVSPIRLPRRRPPSARAMAAPLEEEEAASQWRLRRWLKVAGRAARAEGGLGRRGPGRGRRGGWERLVSAREVERGRKGRGVGGMRREAAGHLVRAAAGGLGRAAAEVGVA